MIIELTPEEMAFAASVAKELHDRLRSAGKRDAHGLKAEELGWDFEAGGAQAELAASKYFEVPWSASLPGHTAASADIGTRTQIRSSAKFRASHSLLVRPRDLAKYGNVPFVLVIQTGNTFEIKGWMMSEDAKKVGRYYTDNGRPPVYLVHESKLFPAQTLKRMTV